MFKKRDPEKTLDRCLQFNPLNTAKCIGDVVISMKQNNKKSLEGYDKDSERVHQWLSKCNRKIRIVSDWSKQCIPKYYGLSFRLYECIACLYCMRPIVCVAVCYKP